MAANHDPLRVLGDLLPSHAARTRFLPTADRSVFGTVPLGVVFVMARWSGAAIAGFAELQRVLAAADLDRSTAT